MHRHPSQLSHIPTGANQRGIVLITGLIFLGILTALGVTAMQSTNLEERMAGNLQSRSQAFQRAEDGLETARDFVANDMDGVTGLSDNGPLYEFDEAPDFDANGAWDGANDSRTGDPLPDNTEYYVERDTPTVVRDPGKQCTVEDCPVNIFTITVRAFDGPPGNPGNATVFLRQRVAKAP